MKGPAPKPEIIMGMTSPDDVRPLVTFGTIEITALRASVRSATLPDRRAARTPGVYEIEDARIEIPLT